MIAGPSLPLALGVLAASAPTAAPVQDGSPAVEAALIVSDVEDRSLGPKRSGMLCMPTGAMRWRDVAPAGALATRMLFGELLAASPFGKPGSNRPPGSVLARVTDLEVNACSRKYMLGALGALSGKGRITVHWTLNAPGATRSAITTSAFSFEKAQAGSGDILAQALSAALRDASASLKPTG